jgi:DNA-binding MarR family transcriptional regulator
MARQAARGGGRKQAVRGAGRGKARGSSSGATRSPEAALQHQRRSIAVLRQFRVVVQAIRAHYTMVERSAGISGAQLAAINQIASTPGLTVSGLATRLGLHQSTVSNLVARLDTLGYVARKRVKGDLRVVELSLTQEGQKMLRVAPKPVAGVLNQALEDMPDDGLIALHRQLDALIKLLVIKDPTAATRPIHDV